MLQPRAKGVAHPHFGQLAQFHYCNNTITAIDMWQNPRRLVRACQYAVMKFL
jgi:hypothetical protein